MAAAGGIRAGKAFVLIEALDKTKVGLQGVHNTLKQFGSEIASAGQNILMKSIGALIPVGLSERIYAEFDDSMRKVEARSSGTVGELAALREEALRLGRVTAFTSSNIGALQAKIAQKGFSRSEIFSMTQPITNLARAAGEGADLMQDATEAATLVSGTIRSYGLAAKDTTHLTDLFSVAVNNSNYTLEELTTSLAYVGPEAKEFGMSVEETLAILASMRDLNIDASIAGTSLRNMFTYLSKESHQKEFNDNLLALTGNTIQFVDAAGNLKPIPDLLMAINKATSGLGTGVRGNIYSEMFGTRVTVSSKAIGRSAEAYTNMLFKLEAQSEGVAQRTHDVMEAGIGGIFRELLSSIESVAISIGETISPPLAILAIAVTKLSRSLSEWVLKNKWTVLSIIGVVVAVGMFGLALTALGVTISIVGSLLASVITILTVVTATLEFVLTPLGAIVLLVIAAVAVLGLLTFVFADMVAELVSFSMEGSIVSAVFGQILESASATIKMLDRIRLAMGKAFAAGDLKLASELAWAEVMVIWTSGTNFILNVWDQMILAIRKSMYGLQYIFLTVVKFFTDQISKVADQFLDIFDALQSSPIIKSALQKALGVTIDDKTIADMRTKLETLKIGLSAIDPLDPIRKGKEEELALGRKQLARLLAMNKALKERDDLLAKAEGLEPETPEDISDILRTRREGLDRRADELIKAGPPGGVVAPKANMGLERGSVEAAKQFQENLYNQSTMLEVAKEHLDVAKEMLDLGKRAEEELREMAGGGV